jgi:hypothetical protein
VPNSPLATLAMQNLKKWCVNSSVISLALFVDCDVNDQSGKVNRFNPEWNLIRMGSDGRLPLPTDRGRMWVVMPVGRTSIKEDGRCDGKGQIAIETETERATWTRTEERRLTGTIGTTVKVRDRASKPGSESARRSCEFCE